MTSISKIFNIRYENYRRRFRDKDSVYPKDHSKAIFHLSKWEGVGGNVRILNLNPNFADTYILYAAKYR